MRSDALFASQPMNNAFVRPALDAMAALLWQEAGLPLVFPTEEALEQAVASLAVLADSCGVTLCLTEA